MINRNIKQYVEKDCKFFTKVLIVKIIVITGIILWFINSNQK